MVTALARVADNARNKLHASHAIHNPCSQKPIPPDVELLFSDGY